MSRRLRSIARGALSIALGVTLVAWTVHAVALASLTLSPTQVAAGGSATGTVTLDVAPLKGSVTVQLTSSAATVATVPASVTLSSLRRESSKTFAVPAIASGCSQITAALSGVQKTALVTVSPPPNATGAPSLTFASNSVLGGQTTTGTVTLVGGAAGTVSVALNSSHPAARVPGSVSVTLNAVEGAYVGSATFQITTTAVGPPTCPVISATRAQLTGRRLLTVLPVPG
jgi:hypothetical protein